MPHDDFRNGHEGGTSESDEEAEGASDGEVEAGDEGGPARALAALNALRKSRQHYDAALVGGGGGCELPAHRAVLAAASPYLLAALPAPAPPQAPRAYRVPGVGAQALRDLLEYAYTGRAAPADEAAARALYEAAWRLRVEGLRARLAGRLLGRVRPRTALELRALPDLDAEHRAALDAYIGDNLEEVCARGTGAALPVLRVEMMRESSAEGGEETPAAVAAAALAWLASAPAADLDLEELCSRTHLLYVDAGGALRDCGELPAAGGDAPELREYRREAAARDRDRERERSRRPPVAPAASPGEGEGELGERTPRPETAVVAARAGPGGRGARATRAILVVRGRLAAARVAWRDVGGERGVARGGVLGGARDEGDGARLATARCAHGGAALGGRLVVCGGYDRARVLRSAEAYDPRAGAWSSLPDMRGARARFPTARLGDALYAIGGSDGHAELDSVDALEGGRWRACARLPLAASHAGAAADEARGELYAVGGWAGGASLRRVLRYSRREDAWREAPPLATARSQCAAVAWDGALWALGGCDAWRCLASAERLPLETGEGAAWEAGPALPTARRSVGGAAWRGRLVSAGGSDGAASLRRTDWLERGAAEWRAGPALRTARAAFTLAALEDVLYAAGGFSGKEFLSCVERLSEPDGEWTALGAPTGPRPPLPAAETKETEQHQEAA